eukprot:1292000-Amphidinium_carterae.1
MENITDSKDPLIYAALRPKYHKCCRNEGCACRCGFFCSPTLHRWQAEDTKPLREEIDNAERSTAAASLATDHSAPNGASADVAWVPLQL